MADPLFTHTDVDGARLVVSRSTGRIEVTEVDDGDSDVVQAHAIVSAPTGEEAVRLARAVLATPGDTGCKVVSEHEMRFRLSMAMANAGSDAARSMRERAAQGVLDLWDSRSPTGLAAEVRALPLLPDGDTTEAQDGARNTLRTDPAPEPDEGIADVLGFDIAQMGRVAEALARLVEPDITPAHDPTVCTDIGCLACRVAQLERDMGRAEQRLNPLEVAQGRVDRLHDRVDALELAERERAQSGGAPRAQVAGGYAEEDDH